MNGDQEDPRNFASMSAEAEDAARLDFMEKQSLTCKHLTSDGKHIVIFVSAYKGKRPPTLREAIDRAMREAAKKAIEEGDKGHE